MQGRVVRGVGRGEAFFFYGTLSDDSRLREVIGAQPARHLGPARVRGVLYDAGEYPALLPIDDGEVPGVLVEIGHDSVAVLVSYEGLDEGLYSRRRIIATAGDGTRHLAWAYVYERPVAGLRRIDDWRTARASHRDELSTEEGPHG